jgi:small redox-active disulfide protein 2
MLYNHLLFNFGGIIMSIFKRKKEEEKCCCGGNCNADIMNAAEENKTNGASVKILGSGCKKCNELEANTVEALKQLGMDTAIDHVTDFSQIAAYGVMSTPALVVNGKVVSYGKVLKAEEAAEIIKQATK